MSDARALAYGFAAGLGAADRERKPGLAAVFARHALTISTSPQTVLILVIFERLDLAGISRVEGRIKCEVADRLVVYDVLRVGHDDRMKVVRKVAEQGSSLSVKFR